MNTFQKGKYNFLILLVYLVTIQAYAGSAFFSIYIAVADGITYFREQPANSNPKHQIVLRKHLNTTNNEKGSGSAAVHICSFSLPEIKDFVYLKIDHQSAQYALTAYGKLKDRAPPQVS